MMRNVGHNFFGSGWLFLLSLVSTPVLIHELGSQAFGLYGVLATLAGYFAVLDLGLGMATIRFVAESRGRGDDAAVGRLIGTAIAAYLLLGAVGAIALGAGASFIVTRVLDLPASLESTARTAVYVTAAGMLVSLPLSILTAIPTALQRLDISNRRNIVFGTLTVGGTIVLALTDHGIVAVLLFTVGVNCLALGYFAVTARRLLPGISLRPRFDRGSLRGLSRFGVLKCINQVAAYSVLHLDKLIVAAFAPVAAVANYVVSLTLAQRTAQLVGNVSNAFLPAASEVHGRDDRERVLDLYLRATKLVGLVTFPLAAILVVFARPILGFWIGGEVADQSVVLLQLLAIGHGVNSFSTLPAVACDSLGRPGVTTAFSVLSAVLNLSLALVLIPRLGAVGAAVAVLLNSALLVPIFIAYVHRRVLHTGVTELARRSLLRPALAMCAVLLPAWALARWASSPFELAVGLSASGALYLGLSFVLGVFDSTDRAILTLWFGRHRAVGSGSVT